MTPAIFNVMLKLAADEISASARYNVTANVSGVRVMLKRPKVGSGHCASQVLTFLVGFKDPCAESFREANRRTHSPTFLFRCYTAHSSAESK